METAPILLPIGWEGWRVHFSLSREVNRRSLDCLGWVPEKERMTQAMADPMGEGVGNPRTLRPVEGMRVGRAGRVKDNRWVECWVWQRRTVGFRGMQPFPTM